MIWVRYDNITITNTRLCIVVQNYRWFVLSQVPNLQNLDMSAVTKTDRVTASCFKRSQAATKAQKKEDEE